MTNKKPAPLNQGEREYKGSHSYINKKLRAEIRNKRKEEAAKQGKTYIDMTVKQYIGACHVPNEHRKNIFEEFIFRPDNEYILNGELRYFNNHDEYLKEYNKIYLNKNSNKLNENQRKKYKEDEEYREKKLQKMQEYYNTKWGKYMAKKYYKENKEQINEYSTNYQKEHKSECLSRQAEHYRAHKDHYHAMIAQASWDRKYGSKHFVLDDGADLKQTYLLLLNNDSFGGFIHRKNNLALSFYILEGEKKNYYLLVNGNLRNRTAEVYEYDLITYSDYFPGERREIKDKEELITLLKLHGYINKKRRDEQ